MESTRGFTTIHWAFTHCGNQAADQLQSRTFVHGDMIRFVAFDLLLRLVIARAVHVTFVAYIRRVHLYDLAADESRFRILFHMIANVGSLCHIGAPSIQSLGPETSPHWLVTSYAAGTSMIIYTIGHSTRNLEEFIELLAYSGINMIVDVRAFPKSRSNPQFNVDTLAQALDQNGTVYRHIAALGGRRAKHQGEITSDNAFWRERGFRNYADYAATSSEFDAGLDELQADAERRQVAIMCAEAVWWRCHRRIITDYLLIRGVEVRHILSRGHIEGARLTAAAVADPKGKVHYPAESAPSS